MPGMDGTGPLGRGSLTGGGRGRCRPVAPAPTVETGEQTVSAQPPQGAYYGLGRGGLPRGCGRGRGFGGGRGGRW
ncbi:hypothetical protein RJ40_02865 [Methanofollis aquaemaris]|uniref:DUF5320 domain-containing protein n=1 Tax=Methanofollis aquaemaris TaxID=126734 RepID=A0A8A3S306_9EURY|nr:DUF5320 domain-containing protein [Methanofollis aquaemaris]QSZ66515.1 hypothetical protein RJ40_02865 [Methanofollis aquaemaris]